MPPYSDIRVDDRDGICWITIDRPEVLNALRRETYAELGDAFRRGTDDPTVGVFVLTGAGERAFCAGGDVRSQAERTPQSGRAHMRIVLELGAIMRNCGKPIIAAINGFAVGGGHELHLMCDLSVAADHAQLGQVGPRVGSIPVWGALQLLPRIVGEKRAREMVYLCQRYSADEALDMGLVNRVVPMARLHDEVTALAQELLDKSPRSLRIAKILMNHGSDLEYNTYIAGAEMLASTYGDEENLEGVHAFLEKRPPDYRKFRRDKSPRLSRQAETGSDMTYETLIVNVDGPAGILTLNRPEKLNAVSFKLLEELPPALAELEGNDEVHGIVLTGSERAFSTGADLSEAVTVDTAAKFLAYNRLWRAATYLMEHNRKPVIAAIRGHCLTGGLELALACDIRIASETASFGITSAKIGSVAGAGGTQRLPRVVGPAVAMDMLFSSRYLDADEALKVGLISRVVPDESVLDTAREMCGVFAERGPLSIAWMKLGVHAGLNIDIESALDLESVLSAMAFGSQDKAEGMTAFLEKRAPVFRGA